MTPEERAEGLWFALASISDMDDLDLIAAAIRQAENDALERAAAVFANHDYWESTGSFLADDIRSLKHPIPSKEP